MFGLRTVRRGQKAAVWNRRGEVKYVEGPARLLLSFGQTLEWLLPHSAAPGEYLSVRFRDGRVEHLRGPVSIWFDPLVHQSVEVCACLPVDANEAIVVYHREGGKVTRRVERGPALFMPTAEEWLHEFRWHGADPKNPDRKVARALQFKKLRVIPDQMYFNVEDVRTGDDALLTVKLMVFFELADVETMLDQTHDPVADFINAVSADVIDFVAGLSFERFKDNTEALNDLATYGALVERGARIGYRITKVVYRGYLANTKLQSMHDGAIEARTKLKLDAETEQQAQELEDLKLQRESQRAEQRRQMQQTDAEHASRLRRMDFTQSLQQKNEERDADLRARRDDDARELERIRSANAEQLAFLKQMSDMQVDLTRYLVAQYQNPDRLIRIDGDTGKGPQLHLHEN